MIANKIDNMASRFQESLSEAQISEINEKAIPMSIKKTKFSLLFFNIVPRPNFTREAEIITLT